MTTDLRDRLAVLCGWQRRSDGYWWHEANDRLWSVTPFHEDDLTALAAAWPAGWEWRRDESGWYALRPPVTPETGPSPEVDDTGDEYADRLRLTVAVLETIARESK